MGCPGKKPAVAGLAVSSFFADGAETRDPSADRESAITTGSEICDLQQRCKSISIHSRAVVDFDKPRGNCP